MIRRLLILVLCLLFPTIYAKNNVVNVYVWSQYVPPEIITAFEKQTGIRVHLSEYDSNETLYAKLKADPNIGYDVIIPSSYFVTRMAREGMLHPIDHTQLNNMKYLNPDLLNLSFDPGNRYSLPYFWGATGIVVDKRYWDPKTITKWSDVWDDRFNNQLLILNDPREAFSAAFIKLGYSINDTNPQHIHEAYLLLRKLMRNAKVFNSDAEKNIYTDDDATVGMGWTGDIYSIEQDNPNLVFIYPKDGFAVWIDCMAVPKTAPHLANAYRFINYLMQPKVAAYLSLHRGFYSPNLTAIGMLPKQYRDNPLISPPKDILKHSQIQMDIGDANDIYQSYWQLLKLGDSA